MLARLLQRRPNNKPRCLVSAEYVGLVLLIFNLSILLFKLQNLLSLIKYFLMKLYSTASIHFI